MLVQARVGTSCPILIQKMKKSNAEPNHLYLQSSHN